MKTAPLNDCGGCEGVEAETPAPIENRAGLAAIAYRCGTHAEFKRSMLAALSSTRFPALAGLATRDDDDFSIALLDAWATAADVFTFYQERIAQESYLRTATERVSLLQLGRLIGYELRPGVAASTYLAFTLETAAGAPASATIEIGSKVQSVPGPGESPQIFETVEKIEARPEWNAMPLRQTLPQAIDAATTDIFLQGTATNLKNGDALLLLGPISAAGSRPWDLCRVDLVDADHAAGRTRIGLSGPPAHFTPAIPAAEVDVFAFRLRSSLFGYNAPDRRVLPAETRKNYDPPVSAISFAPSLPGSVVTAEIGIPDWSFTVAAESIDLDQVQPAIAPGGWVVLTAPGKRALCAVSSAGEAGRTDYALTGKVTRVGVSLVGSDDSAAVSDFGGGALRGTTVFGDSQRLACAEAPVPPIVSGTTFTVMESIAAFEPGRMLAITGAHAGTGVSFGGVVKLATTIAQDVGTIIQIFPALPELDVASVRINANVALATHGESVAETLGSADASTPFQSVPLRQPPLTYVRAAGPGGARSTLEVRVNDLLWREVPSFFGTGPRDRVYITRTRDDGVTTVQFGDGLTGARPPSGQDNLRAAYRRGIGLGGLVAADQLSLLLTRPLGVKAVTNPAAAAGAADREELADARRNAPLTVLTLDRIVSLQDYEDFVRAFAGVAKACATWTWDGGARGVFVTVAGPGGAEIDLTGDFGADLSGAIRGASVPGVPVRVQSYRKNAGLFTAAGRVKIDPDYEPVAVIAAVRAAILVRFSFDAQVFGQPVMLSEVIAVAQATAGVIAVDIDRLSRDDAPAGSPALNPRLVAAMPQAGARGAVSPAELLVLAPLRPDQIGVMP